MNKEKQILHEKGLLAFFRGLLLSFKNGLFYYTSFDIYESALYPPYTPDDYFQVYQMYTIRTEKGKKIRDDSIKYLVEQGIATKVYFYAVHLTQFYKRAFGYKGGELPVTEEMAGQVLTLPMYPALTIGEVDYIIGNINNFFSEK
jgi:perosamine synthetase